MNTSRTYVDPTLGESPITQRLRSEKRTQRNEIKEFRESNESVDPEVWFPLRIEWMEDIAVAINAELSYGNLEIDDPYIRAIQNVFMAAVNAGVDMHRAELARTGDNRAACAKGLRAAAAKFWDTQDQQALGILSTARGPLEDTDLWTKVAANVDNFLERCNPGYQKQSLDARAAALYGAFAERPESISEFRAIAEAGVAIDAASKHERLDTEALAGSLEETTDSPNAWLNRQIELEEHGRFVQVLNSLPLTGNLDALRNLLCTYPELVDENGRLNCKTVASKLGRTPGQISVEWARLKDRAQSAA